MSKDIPRETQLPFGSDELFRLIMESVRDYAIIATDPQGRILSWNIGAEHIFGYTEGEAVGQSAGIIFTPEDRERGAHEQELQKAAEEGRAENERWHVRKDGSRFWASGIVTPLLDESGALRGFVKVARDQTKRKLAEEARLRLATIVELSHDAIISKDLTGRITSWNAGAERLFGYTEAEAVGQPITIIIPPELRAEEEGILRRLRAGERIEQLEAVRVDKRGRRIDVSLSVSPVKDAEGQIIGASKIARDISERRRAEQERQRLLENEQEAREVAEQANSLKDEFLATLSHELRTPLTSILGWARMLNIGQLDAENRARALQSIERNARAQVRLIDDILDVSRIITGNLSLNVQPVDLAPVIEEAIESVRPAAEAKSIRLQRVLDTGSQIVSGDPERLRQVVWNLLSNAVKFTPKGGRVQVRLERVDSHVEVVVSDTGRGINSDVLPHVFERFLQADSSTTREQSGLGLGLSIVRHLVELHGGTVRAESAGEGQGATFTVDLPLMIARTPRVEPRNKERMYTAGRDEGLVCPPELEGLHLLIVDDQEEARALLTTILESCGARVTAVGSAREALEEIKGARFDALLSDIGMPGEDGYWLIKRVRKLPPEQGGQTPAAALTAYAGVKDRMMALRAGYQIHVAKPVDPAELVTVVANITGRHDES